MRKEYIISGLLAVSAVAFLLGSAGIFLIITGSAMAFYAWTTFNQIKLNQRAYEAEIRNREVDADFRSVVLSKVGVLAYNRGELSFFSKRDTLPDRTDTLLGNASPEPDTMPEAMPVIRDVIFLGLIGPQGTGKSTLLKHLIHSRRAERQIIIDPHGLPEDYLGIRPYGLGRNYAEIDECFAMLTAELDNRYNAGHYQHDRLNIYIDELTLLHKNCQNYRDFMGVMLTECRKINIRIVACMHSRRAKILGLEGSYDLAEGLRFLELKNESGRRWGEMETEKGILCLALPGPFMESGYVTSRCHGQEYAEKTYSDRFAAGRDTVTCLPDGTGETFAGIDPEPVSRVYESRDEKRIVEMWRDGRSLNEIARAVWGSSNGRRTAQVKAALENSGYVF